MKSKFSFLIALAFSSFIFSQNRSINYKALVKDGSGNVVANQSITVQLAILQGVGMTNVYQETHAPSTDDNGIIMINIGEGTIDSGVYADIDWRSDDHFLNVQIDTGGGLVDLGSTQFMAVPYALSAANAATNIDELSDGRSDNDGTEDGSSVFLGINAGLNDDATDNKNVGIGFESLKSNTEGAWNTAIGYLTLRGNTVGNVNTAHGWRALFSNTTGSFNIATGSLALTNNTEGNYNIATGSEALFNNTIGGSNTATGKSALYSNTTASGNTATGYTALYSNTTGFGNTAFGSNALFSNTTGNRNTADGSLTLYNNTTGYDNTASGYKALYNNTTGYRNTAYGFESLYYNTTGSWNTAIGYHSLNRNQTGVANTANGLRALSNNTTGSANTATGFDALESNTTGFGNTAYGDRVLFKSSGDTNTAIGAQALTNILTGSQNTAIGYQTGAGINSSSGNGNIFLGFQAGYYEQNNNKLYIENSDADSNNALIYGEFDTNILNFNANVGVNNINPSVPLHILGGTNASLADGSGFVVAGNETAANIVIDDNEIMARDNGATSNLYFQNNGGSVYVGGGLVHSSDRRLKQDIEEVSYGLDEIRQLRAVSYRWKTDPNSLKILGFIAQEVQPLVKELVSVNEYRDKTLALDYNGLIPILVKAIQEQQGIIESQNNEIRSIKSEFDARLERLEALLKTNQN